MDERQREARREAGSVQVLVVLGLLALAGVAALSIDNGYALATRTQLQNAADAGAHAAIGELRLGVPIAEARATARAVANQNFQGYGGGEVTSPGDVVVGSWNYATRQFAAGGTGISAVQVTSRRQIDFFLAPLVGLEGAEITASAVAALGQRDVVLLQDVTASFEAALPDARAALQTFTIAMGGSALAGDRLALVSFNEEATVEQDLVGVPEESALVLSAVDSMASCTSDDTLTHPCRGTNIAAGIQAAAELFVTQSSPDWAEKVIVLISDGVPCLLRNTPTSLAWRDAARAAAEDAGEAGISIYTVFLDQPLYYEDHGYVRCFRPTPETEDTGLMRELVTNTGAYFETPDEEDLDEILLSILRSMPVRVVR